MRVFKNRNYEVGTLFPQFLFIGEAYAYDVGIWNRERVFLNKKQEFARKGRDINTNINGGRRKLFFFNIKGIENEEDKLLRKNLVKFIKYSWREMICLQQFYNIFITNLKWQVVTGCYY